MQVRVMCASHEGHYSIPCSDTGNAEEVSDLMFHGCLLSPGGASE